LFFATNVTLMAGSSMILLPKFDIDEVFRLLPRATVMMGVPTFFSRFLQDARLDKQTTAQMRLFISGSAPLIAETHREWYLRTGHQILERYGMTEPSMIPSNPSLIPPMSPPQIEPPRSIGRARALFARRRERGGRHFS